MRSVCVPNLVKIEGFIFFGFYLFCEYAQPYGRSVVALRTSSYEPPTGYIGYIGNIDDHTKFLRRTMYTVCLYIEAYRR